MSKIAQRNLWIPLYIYINVGDIYLTIDTMQIYMCNLRFYFEFFTKTYQEFILIGTQVLIYLNIRRTLTSISCEMH
jgi:hypothetical protein